MCLAVKQHGYLEFGGIKQRVISRMIGKMKERVGGTELMEFFARGPVLVPAPRSSLIKAESLYPAKVICDEMLKQGFGSEVRVMLERKHAVRKAATAPSRERPTVTQHYESLTVTEELEAPGAILVVDDVITSGAMLVASVSRVQNVFPDADVRAFALIRTVSQGDIQQFYEICTGTVIRKDDWCAREP